MKKPETMAGVVSYYLDQNNYVVCYLQLHSVEKQKVELFLNYTGKLDLKQECGLVLIQQLFQISLYNQINNFYDNPKCYSISDFF